MMYLSSEELNLLAERAEAGIAEVPVKADVLREVVSDAKKYRELSRRYPAPEQDPRDGKRAKSESFLLMSSMKRMAQKHCGNNFAQLEVTVELLELCFLSIQQEHYEAAKGIIGALDGGYSSCVAEDLRRLEQAAEIGWLEANYDEEKDITQLKCTTCRNTTCVKGDWLEKGRSSATVFYSNHQPYPDKRPCRGVKPIEDS